jgi:lipoyl synthase
MRPQINITPQIKEHKPDWLTISLPTDTHKFDHIKQALRKRGLYTVCEESHCPNIPECWAGEGTATFLLMGDVCTRACKFCHIKTSASGKQLDPDEPRKLAEAIAEINLDYAVLTSVDRDDLPDQGAGHFALCIKTIKLASPETIIEVLTPDFRGDVECVRTVVEARPAVYAHNIETVERLQNKVRDLRAGYQQSLNVLRTVKEFDKTIFTKSSLMLGLGETDEEVLQTMRDLREVGVDILTLGQYLKPSPIHTKVVEYITPEKFASYKEQALELGFRFVAAGPFVRSSYRAGELFIKHILNASLVSKHG